VFFLHILFLLKSLQTAKIIEKYDMKTGNWEKINYSNCKRTDYAALLFDDDLMLIGGKIEGETVNTVSFYAF
jgi:hypothetical protein